MRGRHSRRKREGEEKEEEGRESERRRGERAEKESSSPHSVATEGGRERELGMVVLLCSFKTNRKFAQKNCTWPCSLFYSFCVRKLEQIFAQFAQNLPAVKALNKEDGIQKNNRFVGTSEEAVFVSLARKYGKE